MFSFRRRNDKHVYGVLVDIGSGTVGVGIVSSHPNDQLPKIIYSHRTMMRITKHPVEKEERLRRVKEALFSATLALSQEGYQTLTAYDTKARIEKLYVTCSSPWAFTVARNIHYENDKSFKITRSMLQDLIQSAEEEVFSEFRKYSSNNEDEFSIVERATVDISVNDYPVLNPISLKGTVLGLSHIAGLVPKEIINSLHEVQDKLFPETELRAHTYMLVMYCVLRDIFPRMPSLCIIDVTGEATEFGIVENNLLIENTFIQYGSTSFIRDIIDTTDKPLSDIESTMRAYGDETLLSSPDFVTHMELYEKKIEEAIQNILERRAFPSQVVITAHQSCEKIFKKMIENAIKKVTGKESSILSIEPTLVNEIFHEAEPDVYLALGARFFHKLHGCGEPSDA